ncbi:hypothetical protein [Fundicoccus ignavus]|uniref:Uncharacterized protein n=1 Tax=Fundicoccus ignavus TaxID=2664442 RepID=A0A844BZL0_9LACT|nr:hypothetical protein [Fundicoccus ignavus]MRI82310.1 hypothetical protein [Fundicoccus ignavus]MRJ46352.1 hypothetical protein [Fundicoccus ignavus]
MAKHILTQEHIDQLRLSPYILSVTQSQIRYTDELKALYYQKKREKVLLQLILQSYSTFCLLDIEVIQQRTI